MTTGRTATKRQPALTSDIHPEWLNIIRRLQSVARQDNRGLAVLTIKVLVERGGRPCRLWGDPVVTKWEPCQSARDEMERLLENYSKEEKQLLLSSLIDALGREK